MALLSAAGTQLVDEVAARYGLSPDAVTHMLTAVYNGGGTMAQFGHPEFGGSGQWMRGGMTMVSDLFNNSLKNLVDGVCNDLSVGLMANQTSPFATSSQSQSQNGVSNQSQSAGGAVSQNSLFVPDPTAQWWPQELGTPSATGGQNSMRYAYFAERQRLAVTTGGDPWIYDTLDHAIGGFGQQQGGGQSITFTSQYGTVDLSQLPVVARDGTVQAPGPALVHELEPRPARGVAPESQSEVDVASTEPSEAGTSVPGPATSADIFETLEKLGSLMEKGYISDKEFIDKKRELLSRL